MAKTHLFPMSGIWHPQHNPDIKFRGSLERPDLGQTILYINCLSEEEYQSFKETKVIHGMNSSGQKVTLLECFTFSPSQVARSDSPGRYVDKETKFFWNIRIFANYTLIGAHVLDAETSYFKSVRLKSPTINDWGHILYSEYKKNSKNDDPWSTIYQSGFCSDEFTIAIKHLRTESYGLFNEQKRTDLQIVLSKTNNSKISLRQSITIGYPLLRLLTFLCNQDPSCTMFELSYGEHETAQLYLNDSFSTDSDSPHMGDVLSIYDLEEYLPTILSTWYDNHSSYIRMSRLFRQTLADSHWHDEELISAYVRILEMMLDKEKYSLDEKDDQRVKDAKKILKTIDDNEVRDSYLRQLGNGRYKGNTEKFTAYFEKIFQSHDYYDEMLTSLKRSIKIRNNATHLNDFQPATHREHILNDLSIELLQTLIKLRLLEKLGIPEDKCQDLLENHMHFYGCKREFKHLGMLLAELDKT